MLSPITLTYHIDVRLDKFRVRPFVALARAGRLLQPLSDLSR